MPLYGAVSSVNPRLQLPRGLLPGVPRPCRCCRFLPCFVPFGFQPLDIIVPISNVITGLDRFVLELWAMVDVSCWCIRSNEATSASSRYPESRGPQPRSFSIARRPVHGRGCPRSRSRPVRASLFAFWSTLYARSDITYFPTPAAVEPHRVGLEQAPVPAGCHVGPHLPECRHSAPRAGSIFHMPAAPFFQQRQRPAVSQPLKRCIARSVTCISLHQPP